MAKAKGQASTARRAASRLPGDLDTEAVILQRHPTCLQRVLIRHSGEG
jgi:hypothetical protein